MNQDNDSQYKPWKPTPTDVKQAQATLKEVRQAFDSLQAKWASRCPRCGSTNLEEQRITGFGLKPFELDGEPVGWSCHDCGYTKRRRDDEAMQSLAVDPLTTYQVMTNGGPLKDHAAHDVWIEPSGALKLVRWNDRGRTRPTAVAVYAPGQWVRIVATTEPAE